MFSEFPLLQLTAGQQQFLNKVRRSLENYFGEDERRIHHAVEVTANAARLLEYVAADPVLTLTAAYLHDIGIPQAEVKYGRCDGKLQEQEGPPVARMLLAELGADTPFIDRVCEMVGRHHTPEGIDSPEFRILWDADALVNLAEVVQNKEPVAIEAIIDRALVTEPGHRFAKQKYLSR